MKQTNTDSCHLSFCQYTIQQPPFEFLKLAPGKVIHEVSTNRLIRDLFPYSVIILPLKLTWQSIPHSYNNIQSFVRIPITLTTFCKKTFIIKYSKSEWYFKVTHNNLDCDTSKWIRSLYLDVQILGILTQHKHLGMWTVLNTKFSV